MIRDFLAADEYGATSFEPASEEQIHKWLDDISIECIIKDGKVFIKTGSDNSSLVDPWEFAGRVNQFFWSEEFGMDAQF